MVRTTSCPPPQTVDKLAQTVDKLAQNMELLVKEVDKIIDKVVGKEAAFQVCQPILFKLQK